MEVLQSSVRRYEPQPVRPAASRDSAYAFVPLPHSPSYLVNMEYKQQRQKHQQRPAYPAPRTSTSSTTSSVSQSSLSTTTTTTATEVSQMSQMSASSTSAPLPSPSTQQPASYFGSISARPPTSQPTHVQLQRIPPSQQTTSAFIGQRGDGSGMPETAPFLQDFSLIAEAAKRAQMACLSRDLDEIGL